VKTLILEDFQAGYPEAEYSNKFVLEQFQYYLETDPRLSSMKK